MLFRKKLDRNVVAFKFLIMEIKATDLAGCTYFLKKTSQLQYKEWFQHLWEVWEQK